jgi:hypothetical protein
MLESVVCGGEVGKQSMVGGGERYWMTVKRRRSGDSVRLVCGLDKKAYGCHFHGHEWGSTAERELASSLVPSCPRWSAGRGSTLGTSATALRID